jgi:TolB-like protein/tetratricopeptide (TPR) repeat protein
VRFWQELRRRRVFRLAGLYIFGAWALIQVADISFPAWGLPETALRYLFIAAIAGFPIALIFSWFYDITPQGIVRTDPAGEAEAVDLSLKRVDYVVLAALLAIGVTIVLGSLGKIQEEIETGAALTSRLEKMANSLAVLPFTNLDTNPDTAYFSDGITEEILHRLSTMRVLHVLASTSSFAFRDSEETPSSISDRLGVRYLLQGSVRRDGDYVRVTARLLDESGFQVWSDRFDRKMESIFVIQAEIAGTVSSQILNEIVPPKELPAGRTTENMEAYNAYLKGRAYFDARTAGWKERAEEAFRRAIELDPGYAPPYAGLATLPVNTGFGPQWEAARDSALKSLELDPELPLGHAALGLALAAFGENERSAESLRRAIDLDPALAIAHTWITVPLHRLGLHEEARAMEERGLEIDPLSPVLIRNLAGNESNRGNKDRAEKLLLRLAGLPEPPFWIFDSLRVLYSDWGRYADAVESAKNDARLSARYGGDQRPETIASGYTALGLVEDAEYWFEVALGLWEGDEPPVASIYSFAMEGARFHGMLADLKQAETMVATDGPYDIPYLLTYGGLAWTHLGNAAKGIEWLERGISLYQQEMVPEDPPDKIDYSLLSRRWGPDWGVLLAQRLAFAYEAAGNGDDAERALRFLAQEHGSEMLSTNPRNLESLALTRFLLGDMDAALQFLRQALELGWANYYGIVNDPAWAETLEAPKFQAVLAEAKANNDRQRAIVEAVDAEHDFRAEFEQELRARSGAQP